MAPTLTHSLPFWLEAVAQQAVPPLFGFLFVQEEAPVNGHSAGVADYGSDHAPEEHDERNVEECDCDDPPAGPQV